MILIWRDSSPPGDYTSGEVNNYMDLTERFRVNGCQEYPKPFPPSILNITTEGIPADFFFAGPMFIASDRMCDLLNRFDVDAEFFELTTLQQGKTLQDRKFYSGRT